MTPKALAAPADYVTMQPMVVLMELVFGITLIQALLVAARVVPPVCGRCGIQRERRALGERVCRCGE
jgi:hypothetical protein